MDINNSIFTMMCDKTCVYTNTGVTPNMPDSFPWSVLFSGLMSQILVGVIFSYFINNKLKLMDITNNVIIHNKKTMIQLVDELFVNIQKFLYITRSHEMGSVDVINAMRDVDISINRIKLYDGMSDIYNLVINFRETELQSLYDKWKDIACSVIEDNNNKSKLQYQATVIINQDNVYQAEYDRLNDLYKSINNIKEKLELSRKIIKCSSEMLDIKRNLSKLLQEQIDIGNKITTTKISWIQNTHVRETPYTQQLDKLIATLHQHFKKYESHHR